MKVARPAHNRSVASRAARSAAPPSPAPARRATPRKERRSIPTSPSAVAEDVGRAYAEILRRLGVPHILVNAAGTPFAAMRFGDRWITPPAMLLGRTPLLSNPSTPDQSTAATRRANSIALALFSAASAKPRAETA